MSEHIQIDTENAELAVDINAALEEIERQINERDDRIAKLEARLDDQEYSVRRVLEMLIDWLEDEPKPGQPA